MLVPGMRCPAVYVNRAEFAGGSSRDISALVDLGLLRRGAGGGRNMHYELCLAAT